MSNINKMEIIHYIPSIDRSSGGTGFYMQLLSSKLGKLVNLTIVTHKSDNQLVIENANIIYISSGIYNFIKVRSEWELIVNKIKPNVIHINCCWLPFCSYIQFWSKKLGYKTIVSPHGMLEPWIINRNFYTKKLPALVLYQRKCIKEALAIHATAESEERNLLKLGYNNNIRVIPNGVDVNNIEIKRSWVPNKEILFLSRIHVKKGIEILLDSIYEMKGSLYNYKIIIAGEGEQSYIDSLKTKIDNLKLGSIVNIIGGVYGEQKWELFKHADAFILPTFSENFGIVIAESLASGTPVITTTGTPWDELNSNKCGWCIDLNKDNIKKALLELISLDKVTLEIMGRNGRKLIEDKYSTEHIAKEFLLLYKELSNN